MQRVAVHSLGSEQFMALESNDPNFVRVLEFDTETLRRYCHRIEDTGVIDVAKQLLEPISGSAAGIEITLNCDVRTSLRLDRCLAVELGISRSRLLELCESGRVRLDPDRKSTFRRTILNGQRIVLELGGLADEASLRRHALGL